MATEETQSPVVARNQAASPGPLGCRTSHFYPLLPPSHPPTLLFSLTVSALLPPGAVFNDTRSENYIAGKRTVVHFQDERSERLLVNFARTSDGRLTSSIAFKCLIGVSGSFCIV